MRPIVIALFLAASSAAQDRLRDQVDRIYEKGGYERELPWARRETPPPAQARDPGPGEPEPDRAVERNRRPETLRPQQPALQTGALEKALALLPWATVGIVAVFLVLTLLQARRARLRSAPPGRPKPEVQGAPAAIPVSLTDAEALAREGRYEEAIHALLLAAIEAVRRARPLADSLTSREVLRSSELGAGGREALLQLVQAVEVTRFGGRAAGAPEYEACAAAMGRLA